MTGDVRTLLHDTAETPSRAPDIGAALRTARDRRRRRRGFGALAAVVVVALVGGVFVSTSGGGGDDAQRRDLLRVRSLGVPDGWKRVVTAAGHHHRGSRPGGSRTTSAASASIVLPLAAGTGPLPDDGVPACACPRTRRNRARWCRRRRGLDHGLGDFGSDRPVFPLPGGDVITTFEPRPETSGGSRGRVGRATTSGTTLRAILPARSWSSDSSSPVARSR